MFVSVLELGILLRGFFFFFERGSDFPSADSLPKYLRQPKLSMAEARTSVIHPGLVHVQQSAAYLSHHLVSSRLCLSRKLSWKLEPELKARNSDMEGGRVTGHFSALPSPHGT